MKKFILTLSLVVFGAATYAQEKPLNANNPSTEVVATANKKACCSDAKSKTNCAKDDNTASAETTAAEIAVAEIAQLDKSCCKESKSSTVASSEVTNDMNTNDNKAGITEKKSCCSEGSAKSNCSSSGTK
jgi:hypothetical protein